MRQSAVLTDKKAQGQQLPRILGHAAIRAHSERALAVGVDNHPHPFQQATNIGVSAFLLHEEGRNFTNVLARAPAPGAPVNYATPACPAFPQRCPFGGACHACPVTVQAKLAINQPGDSYEQEADRMAERVMRMPDSSTPTKTGAVSTGIAPSTAPPIVRKVLCTPGESLDGGVRDLIESRFPRLSAHTPPSAAAPYGNLMIERPDSPHEWQADRLADRVMQQVTQDLRPAPQSYAGPDFSAVRVHTDARAAASARSLHTLAYTAGRDMVFATGQYAPAAGQGKRLLMHQLAHVMPNAANSGQGVIRRYEAPEHQDFGDKGFKELAEFLRMPEGKKWVEQYKLNPKAVSELDQDPMLKGKKIVIGKIELTPGDVIALMGDFYRAPQALLNAPPEEVAELLAAIKRERVGELGGGKANELYQEITAKYRKHEDTFLELAKMNRPHFTPGNRAEWTKLHLEAIQKARESSLRPAALQEALLIDAAGGHFLTDAFASGHLFNKPELEARIIIYIKNNPPRPANPEIQGYFALSDALGVMPQLVLKNIHDRLNTEGVEVTNNKGMKWRTFGDDRLKNAQETLRIGAFAIYLSRSQIMLARQKGVPDPDPAEVLDLLPDQASVDQVTAKAVSYIPAAATDVAGLLYRQRGSVKAGLASTLPPVIGPFVGGLVKANIETIGSPAREKQLLDTQERARTTGVPQVAPQFTVLSF